MPDNKQLPAMPYKIIPNNTVSIWNGSDELYHIIPSGREDDYIVVDGGPHHNGMVIHMGKKEIKELYGVSIMEAVQ